MSPAKTEGASQLTTEKQLIDGLFQVFMALLVVNDEDPIQRWSQLGRSKRAFEPQGYTSLDDFLADSAEWDRPGAI